MPLANLFIFNRTILLLALLLCSPLLAEETSDVQSRSRATTGTLKYSEKLKRTVKFAHLGPFLGDRAVQIDKGSFNISGTLSLVSFNTTEISSLAFFEIVFTTPGLDRIIRLRVDLKDDPKWSINETKAHLVTNATFDGKKFKALDVKLAWDDEKLKFSAKGNFAQRIGSEPAGNALLAPLFIDEASDIRTRNDQVAVQFVFDVDVGGNNGAITIPFLELGSLLTINVKEVTDPEIGTFRAPSIKIQGAAK